MGQRRIYVHCGRKKEEACPDRPSQPSVVCLVQISQTNRIHISDVGLTPHLYKPSEIRIRVEITAEVQIRIVGVPINVDTLGTGLKRSNIPFHGSLPDAAAGAQVTAGN
jgi:hypothetical protein